MNGVDDVGLLSDDQLYLQLRAATDAHFADLLRSPTVLARGLDATYRVRPHGRMIGEAFVDLEDPAHPLDRLLIVTPPQVGKSTLGAEWGPFWWLCKRPMDRIAVTSYGSTLAVDRGRRVRELVNEHGAAYELELLGDSAAKDSWRLTSGGGLRTVGIGGALTGMPADLLVCDDPHKDHAEANSLVYRDAVWEWWGTVAMSRLQPIASAAVLILTRWHQDDLAGRVLRDEGREDEGGRWRVLHIPAFCTDPERDPLGREMDEPLPHPKIPMRDRATLIRYWNDRKRTSGSARNWAALYMGDPKPAEGALLSFKDLERARDFHPSTEPARIGVAVDPSGGGRDTAGVVGGFLGEDGRLYWTHDRTRRMTSQQWSRAACLLAYEIGATVVVVETNYGGDMALLAIRTAWDALQKDGEVPVDELPPRIESVNAKVGKFLRAEPIAQQVLEDRVRIAAHMPELESEWATWQPADPESPGRIDASVYLAYKFLPVPGAAGAVSSPAQVRRGDVQGGGWTRTPYRRR